MYKKSYTGFILWMTGFLAAMLAICFLPGADYHLSMRLLMLLMGWSVAGLSFIIWRTESVYWINGVSFEEAESAGSERRREFAWRHLRIFGVFALLQSGVTCLTWILGWSSWIDFTFATVGLVAACIRTISIKL